MDISFFYYSMILCYFCVDDCYRKATCLRETLRYRSSSVCSGDNAVTLSLLRVRSDALTDTNLHVAEEYLGVGCF